MDMTIWGTWVLYDWVIHTKEASQVFYIPDMRTVGVHSWGTLHTGLDSWDQPIKDYEATNIHPINLIWYLALGFPDSTGPRQRTRMLAYP
jgi:hypothetical protein